MGRTYPLIFAAAAMAVATIAAKRCEVDSLDHHSFCETATPDLLDQDLSILEVVRGSLPRAECMAGIEVGRLDDYIAPPRTESFVEDFLTSGPTTKLLCFGGDYTTAENVGGHAEIARRGLERALGNLVDRGYIDTGNVLGLAPTPMGESALTLFARLSHTVT